MAQTKTVHTLERARDAFANIKTAIENKTSSSLDKVPVENYNEVIANIPSGGTPVLNSVTVTPDTVSQTIYPEQGVDGFNEVIVNSVELQAKTVTPSESQQTITPDNNYLGLNRVTVDGVALQAKTVTPSTSQQVIIPDGGYLGLNTVTVNAVDSNIDSNIQAENIKSGINILGVDGTYSGSSANLQSNKTVTPDLSQGNAIVTPDSEYTGLEQVTIIKDNNLISKNIKSGVEVFGIKGSYTGDPGVDIKDTPVNLQVVPFSGTVANRLARALVNLDNKLYLMWNDKLYSYDDYSNSWTEYDSNDQFLGPPKTAGNEENPIADDAVLIGSNIVWLYVSGDRVHVRWYEVYTKTLSNDVVIDLYTPTAYTMQIIALCVDNNSNGSDIYFYEIQNNIIYKLRLDVTQGTTTLEQFFSNSKDNIGFYKLIFMNNNLYGIANDGLYKIEYANATKVVTFDDTTSLYRDLIAVDGFGIIYSGGSKEPHSLYIYDTSSGNSFLWHTSTNAVYMNSCTCIKDGKIYRYIYRTGNNNWDYVNKFEIILDNIPVLVIGTNPASYSWGPNRYINTVVVKNMG